MTGRTSGRRAVPVPATLGGEPATFRIGPLTHYAEPAAMREWLANARPGERIIYASGPALGDHAAARLAREWHGDGRVHLFAPRSRNRANCFDYMAEKRGTISAPLMDGAPPAGISWRAGAEGRIYTLLCAVAEARLPCPTNEAIATELGFPDRQFVAYRVRKLMQAGLIRVIEPARFSTRVIEITATAARTAASHIDVETRT